ncbi:MAG: hypothetical protein KH431_06620 [Erysipelotrichaceae bacterium]|nr:hypothetical protein [Erysipelotrichaceae bacterium]
MERWHGLLEYVQFPLKILFFGVVLLGLGSSVLNPNLNYIWQVDNEYIIRICEMLKYIGGFMIQIFPLIVFIKVLSKRFEDSVPVLIGFFGLIILYIGILFFMKTDLPTYFYNDVLGIEINFTKSKIFAEGYLVPYNMGIIPIVATYFITKFAYLRSRHHSMHGVLSFIDHDAWAMLSVFVCCLITGILFAFIWPLIVQGIEFIHNFIADDITSPINLFYYGLIDRISEILHMSDITHSAFWMGEAGGSLIDASGIKHVGDVAIWTYQATNSLDLTAGRFITPYYIMNIFMIPGFLLGYYSLVKSKRDRSRYLMFFILAVVLSILCGNTFPFEIFMLVMAPLLYVTYLIISAMLFAVFQILNVHIGYNLSGTLMTANPGSLLDLIPYFRNPDMVRSIITVLVVGIICFLLFFMLTRIYFKKFALGLLQLGNRSEVAEKVVNALGGIDNILAIESSPDKLTASLINRDLVDFEALKENGAYLILQAKEGYLIRLGNISTIVGADINHLLKQKQWKAE